MDRARIRSLQLFAFVTALMLLQLSAVHAQTGRARSSAAFTEIKWEGYTFKFLTGNQMAQVLNANGQVIGTILSMNGGLQLLPTVTGPDAEKLKESFEEWKAQGGEKALTGTAPQSQTRESGEGATTARAGGVPSSSRAAAPGAPARVPGNATSPPPSVSAQASSGFKYGILDETGLNQLGKGAAIRLDLNLFRLSPELLDQKHYMQYFIALNNCDDKNVAKMLNNELDYPDLVALYKPKAQEILNGLPMSAGLALYAEAGLWKKPLTLGEYDKSKGSFPILYGSQPDGAEVPATISYDFGKTEYRATCPVANQVLSSVVHGAMPASYSISVQPMSFKELQVDEAGARKYIQSVGGSQRVVVLLVDIHLLNAPPGVRKSGSTITAASFTGEIGRVRVAKMNGDTVGVLFDNHSLPPP